MQFSNGSYQSEPSNSRVIVDPNSPSCISAASGAKTVTGNSNAYAAENANAAIVTVIVSAVTGSASPTLTPSFQDAATFGGSYTTEGSGPAITAAGTYQFIVPIKNLFWRISWVISGTSPSFAVDFKVSPFVYGAQV